MTGLFKFIKMYLHFIQHTIKHVLGQFEVMKTTTETADVLAQLDETDREFIVRFVLASGSLKDVAQGYGVSYPTLRAKLDRLIHRLQQLRQGQPVSPLRELLASLVERGELSAATARRIVREHCNELEQSQES